MTKITLPNNWQPRSYQLGAWRYLERGGNHAELIWHRRSGKDDVALNWAAVAAHQRVANYWHMLPEAAQARKAIWDAVNPHTGRRRIDEAFPLELREKTRENEMQIVFKIGSSWQVVGSDNFNSLVGSAPAGIVYSEWALANPNARAYLRPIIAENNGWQAFITTPRGRNHAYVTLKAAEKLPGAFAQVLSAHDTDVFSAAQLNAELSAYISEFGEEYGRSRFEQEYECSFDAANLGAILARPIGVAEREDRINDDVVFDQLGAGLHITSDIGHHDTSTWWFWQPAIGGYRIVDHDSGWGMDAAEWCDRLEARIGQYRNERGEAALDTIWLPHDARAKTFSAKRSAVEIFVERFGASKVKITPSVKVADRINAARVLMPKVAFNATKCERGLESLRAWSFEYNDDTKTFSKTPKHDWASHDGDGFSYGCVVMTQTRQKDAPQKSRFLHEMTANELFWPDKQASRRYERI